MVKVIDSKKSRIKRRKRIRAKISGTAACPRLSVFRSAKHIYAQIIDDEAGKTLCSASTMEKSFEGFGGNAEAAKKVFITEDTGGKRQTHYNIRTRVNKNGKRKKRKANLQTCKTCSTSTPTHVRVH